MSTTPTGSDSNGRAFYAPATFQFSSAPGRVERVVTRLFGQRGAMEGHPRALPVREFYAPATFQFSAAPGRVERLTARALRQRGAMDGRPRAGDDDYAFYAPATTHDAVGRGGRRPAP